MGVGRRREAESIKTKRTAKKDLPKRRQPHSGVRWIPMRPVLARAPSELGAQHHEGEERNHLDAEAGQQDVDAALLPRLVAVGAFGDGAAGALEKERHDVEADEEETVGARPQAREGLAVRNDDSAEAEVEGRANERRRNGQDDDLTADIPRDPSSAGGGRMGEVQHGMIGGLTA